MKEIRIGRCIYCGTSEGPLTKEHVIPRGLNGEFVLQEACCNACKKAIDLFETKVLRNTLRPSRAHMGLRTYGRNGLPREFPEIIERNGCEETVNMSVDEMMSVIPSLDMGPPAYLHKVPHAKGLQTGMAQALATVLHPRVDRHEKFRKHRAAKISTDVMIFPKDFVRMIAKIAYGYAVGRCGLDNIEEIFVLRGILTEPEDLVNWVGGDGGRLYDKEEQSDKNGNEPLHWVNLTLRGRAIIARVRLFAPYNVPEYIVVVGSVTKSFAELVKSESSG